jgi:hypothetical protein
VAEEVVEPPAALICLAAAGGGTGLTVAPMVDGEDTDFAILGFSLSFMAAPAPPPGLPVDEVCLDSGSGGDVAALE